MATTTTTKCFAPPKTGWSSAERPHFSPGLLLEDEDLNSGVSYTRGLMRLLVKSVFGCGVVCGLKVTAVPTCKNEKRRIDVSKGVAFTCDGDIIEVCQPFSYEFGRECEGEFPGQIWVLLCYREKCCRPRDAGCDDKSGSSHTRVRSGYEIKLCTALPKCGCRCGKGKVELNATPAVDGDDCCGGAAIEVDVATAEGEDETDPCKCYTDHFNGVCDCDCGCDCVVLGVVDPALVTEEGTVTYDPPIIHVYDDMVRRVRPILNGHVQCLMANKTLDSEAQAMKQAEEVKAAMQNMGGTAKKASKSSAQAKSKYE